MSWKENVGRMVFAMAYAWLGVGCYAESAGDGTAMPEIVLSKDDRILILAPHPDDESIACGGVIQDAVALGIPIRVVFFTYGDNNEWSFAVYRKRPVLEPEAVRAMGEVRHGEALEAGRKLGLSAEHLTFLGYPDFGTLKIWYAHWGDRPAFRSMLTRVTEVPYPDAMRPGAAYKGEEIIRDLSVVLTEFKPTKIFVSHPFDHNPDHGALYLFATIALWDLKGQAQAEVIPYLVHWPKWPSPEGYHPDQPQCPPAALTQRLPWYAQTLASAAVERKRTAVEAHKTQYGYGAKYLLSFVRSNELFGVVPVLELPPPGAKAVSLEPGGLHEAHHELNDEERARFVGFEQRELLMRDGSLEFHFRFSRPLEEATSFSLYMFGYRRDRPFGNMPKIHVRAGPTGHEILDQDREVNSSAIVVTRDARNLSVTVPLTILGSPEKILTSARTYLGELPLDWLGWRILAPAGDH